MSNESRDCLLVRFTLEFFKAKGWTNHPWEEFHEFVERHPDTPKETSYAKISGTEEFRKDVNGRNIIVKSPIWGDLKVLRSACSRLYAEAGLTRTKQDGTTYKTRGGLLTRQEDPFNGPQFPKLASKYRDLIAPPEGVSRGKSQSKPVEFSVDDIPEN